MFGLQERLVIKWTPTPTSRGTKGHY